MKDFFLKDQRCRFHHCAISWTGWKTRPIGAVSKPVSPVLEMTEIQTRLLAQEGPAVLFENVVKEDGSTYDMPVLVNLFGTVERVAWGMDREPSVLREIGETLAFLKQPEPPGGFKEALKLLPLAKTVMSMKPKTVRNAPCQEVVFQGDDIDLSKLPVQTCWPGEPAPLITWPLVVTHGPGNGKTIISTLHLSYAGLGQRPLYHALAETSRRGTAFCPLGERKK